MAAPSIVTAGQVIAARVTAAEGGMLLAEAA
jgi:hypothetical protein